MLAAFGDWKLVATSDDSWPAGWKSAGWDATTMPPGAPTSTGTGMKTAHGQNPARVGERWSVRGFLERPVFAPADGPLCIWTAPGHMRRIE
ncbi:MAG: hypothetical protein JXP34_04195 [Planctomycetes bacterium]|nr:hypothetical protein [Planctomycetota bacterium]